jgi:hypothetical protein
MVSKFHSFCSTLTSVVAFESRDGATHRQHAQEWQGLPEGDQEDFLKEHGARYSELSWLPYFNPVHMTVVDPMHNILLGKFLVQPGNLVDSDSSQALSRPIG